MNRPYSSTTDQEYGDSFLDVSKNNRRLVRVSTKTYQTTGTYISLKLFKKGSDDDFYIDQRITLTVQEFQDIINNVENINMGPSTEPSTAVSPGTLKRPEKPVTSAPSPKISKT